MAIRVCLAGATGWVGSERARSIARRADITVVTAVLIAIPALAHGQWIVSAYGGAMRTESSDVRIEADATNTSLVFEAMRFESRSSESPIYYGYRIGHRVRGTRWLFVEAEVIHGKVYPREPAATMGMGTLRGMSVSRVAFDAVVQDFNLSHGLNFILINALARHLFANRRVTATARLGAGPVLPHVESLVDGDRREDYQWAGVGTQVSGGGELTIWRRLAVTAEYKWTHTRPRVSLARGDAMLTTSSHHIAIGLAAVF
jgi:hypothetical protein